MLTRSKHLLSTKKHSTVKTLKITKRYNAKETRVLDSFLRGTFLGEVREKKIFPYPDEILNDEQRELLNMMEPGLKNFYENVNNPKQNDETESVPKEVLDALADLGGFGLQVPIDLEGAGLSNTAYARTGEMMGYGADLGLSILVGAHQSIGFKGILIAGNEQQKEKYLPDLASGRKIAAFALTEPSSGSDANSIKSTATLSEDGKHWILNGSKIWISNGGLADVFTVFAQTEVDDEKTGGKRNKVTAFIVERSFGGVTHGPPEKKMGIKASNTAEVFFKDTPIPVENVIDEVGAGFKVSMRILNNGRFGMGAALTGVMKYCLEKAVDHANNRTQFGRKLKDFEIIQSKITEMALKIYATESMTYLVSSLMDSGSQDYELEAASLKIFAAEAAWFVCDEAIQILGGMGFMKDTELERVMRDLRIFRIFEGTNEILRFLVAGTGMKDLGKKLKEGGISGAAIGLIKRRFSSGGKIELAAPELKASADRIQTQTETFHAIASGVIMNEKHGLIEKQMQLTRISNIAINLFAMAAVTSRASRAVEMKKPNYEKDVLLANTFTKKAEAQIEELFKELRDKKTRIDDTVPEIASTILANGYDLYPPVETKLKN